MARYVLLEFDDNKEAEDFVAAIRDLKVVFARPVDERHWKYEEFHTQTVRTTATFFKPTQFCQCEQGTTTARGKKYGLEVHSCGKPIRGRWQHPKNLSKEDDKTLYEQGLYLGIVEPQDGEMPKVDFLQRGKALGVTRRNR